MALNNIEKLLDVFSTQIQELEDVFAQIRWDGADTTTTLDIAVGDQLDGIGQIVGEDRNGRTDDAYRLAIRAKILINVSSGTPEEMLTIAIALTQSTDLIEVVELFPASLIIRFDEPMTADEQIVANQLNTARAAAVAFALHFVSAPGAEIFTFGDADVAQPQLDANLGFGDADDNLLLQPQRFDGSLWLLGNASVTPNTKIAPDGLLTADTLRHPTGSNSVVSVRQVNVAIPNTNTHTWAARVAPDAVDWVRLVVTGGATAECFFDVQNGVVGTSAGAEFVSAAMFLEAEGFYRCEVRFTPTVADHDFHVVGAEADGDFNIVGPLDLLYLWEAQVNEGTGAAVISGGKFANVTVGA